MNEHTSGETNPEARFLSINLRLSMLESLHSDLSVRVDEIEEELHEIWEAIEKGHK